MRLFKIIAVALITLLLLLTAPLNPSVTATAVRDDFDAAAVYKSKCALCHGQKAEKKFDPAKTDDELTEIVLKSDRPGMPAYETKGINAEQAKALVLHMKSLRQWLNGGRSRPEVSAGRVHSHAEKSQRKSFASSAPSASSPCSLPYTFPAPGTQPAR